MTYHVTLKSGKSVTINTPTDLISRFTESLAKLKTIDQTSFYFFKSEAGVLVQVIMVDQIAFIKRGDR